MSGVEETCVLTCGIFKIIRILKLYNEIASKCFINKMNIVFTNVYICYFSENISEKY